MVREGELGVWGLVLWLQVQFVHVLVGEIAVLAKMLVDWDVGVNIDAEIELDNVVIFGPELSQCGRSVFQAGFDMIDNCACALNRAELVIWGVGEQNRQCFVDSRCSDLACSEFECSLYHMLIK